MATSATIAPAALSLDPGTAATLSVSVLNDTLLVESFELAAVGEAAAWTRIEPATLTIYPGQTEQATVTVLAPRLPDSAVGQVALGIRARAVEQPDVQVVAEAMLTVNPFAETEAELIPRIAHGRGRKRVRVAIDNRGNVPLVAAIAGQSDDRLGLSTPTPDVSVDPGHTEFVDVDLRPTKRVWRGDPVTHQYSVAVAPEGADQPFVLPGSYVQERVFPKWLWKLLLALLLLLLLLLALWFFVLKPTIESAARDAVEEPLAQANEKADSASEQAGSAAEQADSAAQTANEALEAVGKTPAPVTPVSKTTSVDIRFELTATTAQGEVESDRWVVPAKSVLRITDIVISNPSGDFGVMTLENADIAAPIFTTGLENFRDIDFHWVTAVELAADDELFATLTCSKVAPPVTGPARGACEASVLITGRVVTTG
ncbi:hypothetical protein SAMN05428970_0631 [Agromyces sp. CF514]|uniref:COG1470 family protein n=1 Tax=Agromyces sp. CF514 TaxID=1881031 RepID=UPI0008E262C6|nr:hypothetical protein [Agromyces sp. CF514]SFR69207.1 hypothetical protein SAMN05428970_0631 [Agromyces sp. CF514]